MLAATFLALALAGPTDPAHGDARLRLDADIRFLADDLLEGRGTPGRGLDLAAIYLAAQLRAAGFKPADGKSYLQPYPVAEYVPGRATTRVSIGGHAVPPGEFLLLNTGQDPARLGRRMGMVFAGHGVVSAERGLDDLAGLDLRGRAVVVLKGAPWGFDRAVPFGPGQGAGKAIEAAIRGAALLVYVTDDFPAKEPPVEVAFMREMSSLPVAFLPQGAGRPPFAALLMVSPTAFDRLLAKAAGGTYAALQRRLAAGERIRATLPQTLDLSLRAKPKVARPSNVVAVLPGADAGLRDEWVVLSAHYDHLGMREARSGEDRVFHGADDNASGTAAVLQVARRLASGPPPRRSVMVLLVSGEERMLLGSAHFASASAIPPERIACDINVDMVGRSAGTVQVNAPVSPELLAAASRLGATRQIQVVPDEHPEWRSIYLTDTYHFARRGVPAIEFFTGMHEDYHQTSDVPDKIRLDELARVSEVVAALADLYAQGAPRPGFDRPAWFLTPEDAAPPGPGRAR